MLSSIAILGALLAQAVGADGFDQEQLARSYKELAPAIGLVTYSSEVTNPQTGESTRRNSTALGLVVAEDGLVMTHGHMVLDESQPFNIQMVVGRGRDEKTYDALLLQKPDDVNVAFLRLQSEKPLRLPYARFRQEVGLELGTPVAVLGLLSESLDHEVTITEARVGAVLEKPRKTYCLNELVQFGFVGGPVINEVGRVVGVIGFDLSPSEGGDLYVRSGHPLIYPTSLLSRYISSPPGENAPLETADYAWLGVYTQPLTDDFAEYWGLEPRGGLVVSTVVPASPAFRAGFQPGDVIVDFNGTPIRSKLDRDVAAFTKLVRETGADEEVTVDVLRNGEPQRFRLKLGIRPRSSRDAGEFEDTVFGLTVRELTADVRIALNLGTDVSGVIVRRVKSGSPAQMARMRPGVIIMSFGDYPTGSLEEFQAAVAKVAAEKPAEVAVFARVGTATGFFRIEPRWPADE